MEIDMRKQRKSFMIIKTIKSTIKCKLFKRHTPIERLSSHGCRWVCKYCGKELWWNMTLKEARYEIQEKYNNEEDYYREFGEYSAEHSDKLQKALDVALDAFDVLVALNWILKTTSKYQ